MKNYDHKKIEKKWQEIWEKDGSFRAEDFSPKPKYYCLIEFPYPSGDGLHTGHIRSNTAMDIIARKRRAEGYNVLYPIGWDAFGLPTENYAVKTKTPPQVVTKQNTDNFRRQLKSLGFSFDWAREINTTDPGYYKWTQWIFIQMWKKGLAYKRKMPINWCLSCKIGLANEEVVDGACERCGGPTEKRDKEQWMLAITKYADRLYDDLDKVDYLEKIKIQQRNWIGKSQGSLVSFALTRNNADMTQKDAEGEIRSYIMGVGEIENELKAIGVKVDERTKEGDYKVIIPKEKISDYEDLIIKVLKPGFWNEYISGQAIFIFKDKLGIVKRYVWDENHENDLLDLCNEYANEKFKSVRKMLERNSWYGNFLRKSAYGQQQSATSIEVFTTRPDTLFGATYMVLAPDHDLIPGLKDKIENWDEVESYITLTGKKTEIERTAEGKEKTGVELKGIKAINPANKEEIPIFIADYVLKEYGTGAIMAVPAHDERDFEFAKKFNLPVKNVIEPLFVQKKEPGAVRDSEPFVEREAITAIVKHWDEDKYIGLKWKKVDWDTLVTGGVEKGQTPEEAAVAEIREETGFQNIKLAKILLRTHAKFFHVPKKQNRFAHFHVMYFELADGERKEVSPEEEGNHEAVWLTKEQMERFRLPESHRFSWKNLIGDVVYAGSGIVTGSGKFNGMDSEEAKKKITESVGGQMKTTYKLRDWIFSRQRYWGEPIPIIHCEKCGFAPVSEKDLPVLLPEIGVYTPTDTGESPLSKISEWVNVKCPACGGNAKRETDTMPNWAGSSWYYLRYVDPHDDKVLADPEKLDYFMPVDWYNGGMEHTTLHLLYSRFWHKFLFDIGIVSTDEPYAKRTSHGMILAEGGEKMSKSKGNIVNPDSIVETYGADTLRLYEMFMGPFDQPVAWSTESIIGPRRFLERVWRLKEKVSDEDADKKFEIVLNNTIKKVTEDMESMSFNTAVSGLMILLNDMEKRETVSKKYFEIFLRLLAPFAPHITEELWSDLGNTPSIHSKSWPKYDESKLAGDTETIVIQINGKVRGSFVVPSGTAEESVKERALGHELAQKWLEGKEPKRIVYVKGKLVSIVL